MGIVGWVRSICFVGRCGDTMPPFEVMRAMSVLQLIKGTGGVVQYAYYGLFGYPSKTDYPPDVVQKNLDHLARIGQVRLFFDAIWAIYSSNFKLPFKPFWSEFG